MTTLDGKVRGRAPLSYPPVDAKCDPDGNQCGVFKIALGVFDACVRISDFKL
jgi:hypothetical protein